MALGPVSEKRRETRWEARSRVTILCPYSLVFPLIPSRNRVTIWISYGSVQASNLRVGGSNPSRRAIWFQVVADEAASALFVGSGTHLPLTHLDAPNALMFHEFSIE